MNNGIKLENVLPLVEWAMKDPKRSIRIEVENGKINKAWAHDGTYQHISTVEEAEKLAEIARENDLKKLAELKAKYPDAV